MYGGNHSTDQLMQQIAENIPEILIAESIFQLRKIDAEQRQHGVRKG